MWRSILDHGITANFHPPTQNGVEELITPARSNNLEAFPSSHPNIPPADLQTYQQKKTFAQGMFDLALLTANANQLRYVLDAKGSIQYRSLNLTLIIISLLLQLFVAVMLIWNSLYDIKRRYGLLYANRINNLTVCGVFFITITNLFISVFAVE